MLHLFTHTHIYTFAIEGHDEPQQCSPLMLLHLRSKDNPQHVNTTTTSTHTHTHARAYTNIPIHPYKQNGVAKETPVFFFLPLPNFLGFLGFLEFLKLLGLLGFLGFLGFLGLLGLLGFLRLLRFLGPLRASSVICWGL